MLDQMRKGSKNIFIYFFFAILIIVFTFYFGPGVDGCSPSTRRQVASVAGHDIYNTDLATLTNRLPRRNQTADEEWAKTEKQAAERLALIRLLSERATAMGFAVSDEELRAYILDEDRNLDYRIYSPDGKFDGEIYQNFVVNGLLMTIEDYQELKRSELLIEKYIKVLENSLTVSPKQVDELNVNRNTKLELEFVAFDPTKLEDVLTFTDAEVAAFIGANEAKLKKYYDDNPKEFGSPKEVRRRRVMVNKPKEDADSAAKATANNLWAKVKDRVLTKKEDLAAVATEDSEDIVYKSKGGDMGWFEMDNINPDEAKLLETMKKGDVKEFENKFGWFLIKLEDVREANFTPFNEVKNDIAKKLLIKEKGTQQLKKLADALLAEARKDQSKSLEDAVKALAEAAKPTPPPTPTPTPGETPGEETPGEETPGEETPGEETPPTPEADKKSPWDLVSATTTGKFSREPRRSFKYDQDKGTIVQTSLPWTDIPRIGDDKALAQAVWSLTKEAPLHAKVVTIDDKLFIVRLKERVTPTAEDLEKSRPGVEAELRRQLLTDTVGSYQVLFIRPDLKLEDTSPFLARVLQQAKDTGKIRIMPDAFETPAAEGEADPKEGEGEGAEKKDDAKKEDAPPAEKK